MCTLTITNTFVAGTKAKAAEVNTNFTDVKTVINGNIDATNIAANGVGASEHADMSANTDTKHSATSSAISDGGSYFLLTQVEGALQELGKAVGLVSGVPGSTSKAVKYVGTGFHATAPASATVTIPANTASASGGLIVQFSAQLNLDVTSQTDIFLPINMKVGGNAAADLSVTGTRDGRFHIVLAGDSTDSYGATIERTMILTAATTAGAANPFDPTEITILKGGTAWTDGTIGADSDISIIVQAF